MVLARRPICFSLQRINVQDFTQDRIPKNLLILSFGDSCFVSDCFMPDTGNKSANMTDKISTPYIWNASFGKTDKDTKYCMVVTGLENNKEDNLSRGITPLKGNI